MMSNSGQIPARLLFVALISLPVCNAFSEQAYFTSQDPNCSLISNMPWRNYLSGQFPESDTRFIPRVGIKFIYAKEVNDPSAMYGLDPGICYSSMYFKTKTKYFPAGFSTERKFGYERRASQNEQIARSKGITGQKGDPSAWEVNIWGNIFIYNALGEIFNNKGKRIGQMYCYTSNDCGKYGY